MRPGVGGAYKGRKKNGTRKMRGWRGSGDVEMRPGGMLRGHPYHPPSTPFQLEERAARSAEFGNSLQSSRCEIADLNVRIQKLRSQIVSVKSHVRKLPKGQWGFRGQETPSVTWVHTRPAQSYWDIRKHSPTPMRSQSPHPC